MADAFLLVIRWLHVIAAAAWVGGGIFYWVVVRPALKAGASDSLLSRFAGPEFGQVVNVALWVLVVTGAVLAFDRLSQDAGAVTYFTVLSVKVALVGWMFFIIQARRRRPATSPPQGRLGKAVSALGNINMTVVLGIVVFVLSDVLRWLVERDLAG